MPTSSITKPTHAVPANPDEPISITLPRKDWERVLAAGQYVYTRVPLVTYLSLSDGRMLDVDGNMADFGSTLTAIKDALELPTNDCPLCGGTRRVGDDIDCFAPKCRAERGDV